MINLKIVKSTSGVYEAYVIKDCKCNDDSPLATDQSKESLKEKLKELYSYGQRNPVKYQIVEEHD